MANGAPWQIIRFLNPFTVLPFTATIEVCHMAADKDAICACTNVFLTHRIQILLFPDI
jgi:hypothetical protein